LNPLDGADPAAQFLVEVTRKRPGQRWREDFTVRSAMINGLPGIVVDAPGGLVQTSAFDIESSAVCGALSG
jgi:RNA polymerase sigma-70 factor (ECF subfamily)